MASDKTIGRIQAQIQRRAAHCLQHEIADPRASFVTITRVELSQDLTLAKIYYSVLGEESDISRVEHMLDHASGFIQRQVGSILRMRRIPTMRWIYDASIAEADRMERLIQDTLKRDAEIRGSHPEVELHPEAEGPGETAPE
ncbi:MAG: 30S ribosome-binding factor RbfA [Planctomycetota bacterium]